MQEEVEQKTIALVVNTAKFNARTLAKLALAFLREMKKREAELKNPTQKRGKQSVKRLGKQNQGLTNIEITDKNIKCFERHAKKHGVDFALKKDKSVDPPKYVVFFKGRDEDAIKSAFMDYTKSLAKKSERPSVKERLQKLKLKNKDKSKSVAKELTKSLKKKLDKGGMSL